MGYFLPAKVEGLKGKNVIDIACGLDTVFALTKSGEVYSFTTTKLTDLLRSRVPLGHNERTHNEPVQVKLPGKAVSLSAGLTHALAVAGTSSLVVFFGWAVDRMLTPLCGVRICSCAETA